MKLFLLFLVLTFVIGIAKPAITVRQQRWLIGAIVMVIGISYFLFDGLI